jgi:hypothetical protein
MRGRTGQAKPGSIGAQKIPLKREPERVTQPRPKAWPGDLPVAGATEFCRRSRSRRNLIGASVLEHSTPDPSAR